MEEPRTLAPSVCPRSASCFIPTISIAIGAPLCRPYPPPNTSASPPPTSMTTLARGLPRHAPSEEVQGSKLPHRSGRRPPTGGGGRSESAADGCAGVERRAHTAMVGVQLVYAKPEHHVVAKQTPPLMQPAPSADVRAPRPCGTATAHRMQKQTGIGGGWLCAGVGQRGDQESQARVMMMVVQLVYAGHHVISTLHSIMLQQTSKGDSSAMSR